MSTETGNRLASREKRLRLKIGVRHSFALAAGLHLVYRRARSGDASWSVRRRDPDGRKTPLRRLGAADDATHPDGITILSFEQAVKLARSTSDGEADTPAPNTLTVKQAADRYMVWYRDHRKGVMTTQSALRVHILPAFGHRLVVTLKAAELTAFLNKMAMTAPGRRTSALAKEMNVGPAPVTDDAKRQRRSTANRVYNVLRALLNKAFTDGLVTSDTEWRRVEPHRKADAPRVRFLTRAESIRLVNACPAPVKSLVRGALATGARYGELVRMQCGDFSRDTGLLWIRPGKSDHGRHVPLNAEGLAFFKGLSMGRPVATLMFPRGNREWRAGEQRRPLEAACAGAKIEPAISFHELRHTYASQLAQVGVDLLTISKLLGHADTRVTSSHYAHLADQSLRNAVALLPRLLPVTKARVQAIR